MSRFALLLFVASGCGRVGFDGDVGDTGADDASVSPDALSGAGCIRSIAAGERHTCVLRMDGQILCWGQNNYGQLGTGMGDSATPAPVRATGGAPFTDFTQLALGTGNVSCGLRGDQAWCWGINNQRQLGSGTVDQPFPVRTGGTSFTGITRIIPGETHSCAIRSDTSLWCWGENSGEQLGRTDVTSTDAPLPVESGPGVGVTNARGAFLGIHSTCYWDEEGTPSCFGNNDDSMLAECVGAGHAKPVPIGAPRVRNGSAGAYHACVNTQSGEVWCWGKNDNGECGNSEVLPLGGSRCIPDRTVAPMDFSPLSDITQVGVGDDHTCAIDTIGRVFCWGDRSLGAVGTGSLTGNAATAERITALGNAAIQVAIGNLHSCVLLDTGVVECWGANDFGQLGRGFIGSPEPVPAATLDLCN